MNTLDEKQLTFCQSCIEGKQHMQKLRKQNLTRATQKSKLIHSNICGPMQVATRRGYLYFVTFIDYFTRLCYIYLMKNKSEAFNKFQLYKKFVEKQTTNKIKIIRTYQGGDYLSNEFISSQT